MKTRMRTIILLAALIVIPMTGFVEAASWDVDDDTIENNHDNCPEVANTDQANNDGDFWGDLCDEDDDNDGLSDAAESELGTDPMNPDTDGDQITDLHDCAPTDPQKFTYEDCFLIIDDGPGDPGPNPDDHPDPDLTDTDGDGCTDAVEIGMGTDLDEVDTDDDGVGDCEDNCPIVSNPDQEESEANPDIGAACFDDYDGDGVSDGDDNCPRIYNPAQLDSDRDGVGEVCDPDSPYFHRPEPILKAQGGAGEGCSLSASSRNETANAWSWILMFIGVTTLVQVRRKSY